MSKERLADEIRKWQETLAKMAAAKQNALTDPELYKCSCLIDRLIVAYMQYEKYK